MVVDKLIFSSVEAISALQQFSYVNLVLSFTINQYSKKKKKNEQWCSRSIYNTKHSFIVSIQIRRTEKAKKKKKKMKLIMWIKIIRLLKKKSAKSNISIY